MPTYRFKTRSVVPGANALRHAALVLVAGYPTVGNVRLGVAYGTSGTEFTGTLAVVITGGEPAPETFHEIGSVVIDVAEAVKVALNAGDFAQTFDAVRAYRPRRDVSDVKDLQVTVVPRGKTVVQASRSRADTMVDIDVGIQQRVGPGDAGTAAGDAIMLLAEEFADALVGKPLPTMPRAVVVGVSGEPIWSAEHLAEHTVLTVVQTFSVKVME